MESNWIEWAWDKLRWVRGIIAAISLVAIADYALGWDRVEFLEFTHALISSWDTFANWFYSGLGRIVPYEVEFTFIERQATSFLLVVLVPIGLGQFTKALDEIGRSNRWQSRLLGLVALLPLLIALFGLVNMSFVTETNEPVGEDASAGIFPTGFYAVLTLFVALTLIRLMNEFVPQYLKVLAFGFAFMSTLQLLHYMPVVHDLTAEFVKWSKTQGNT